nr:right-handed parallel beta-helix repeat-containing protein [Bacteroidota bacterium]
MKKLLSFFAFVACFCNFSLVVSQTTIPPDSEVHGTWSLSGSPYVLEGEATIPQGKTLTVEPGVEVRFNTEPDGYLRVYGKLIAQGTESSEILFTRDGAEGNWGEIHFYDSANDSSLMQYCTIEYANRLFVDHAMPTFKNILVTNNVSNGISIDNGNPKFINSAITGNGGAGFYLDYSNPKIIGCLISNNGADGVHCHANSDPGIINSTIVNNDGTGVYAWQYNSYPYLKNSILWGNNVSVGGSAGGVNVYYSLIEEPTMPPRGIDQGNNIFGYAVHFENPSTDIFELLYNSPCIESGTPDTSGLNLPVFDLNGNPRIQNGIVDMGAFEYQQTDYLRVLRPNGGESWLFETPINIQWLSTATEVKLEYTTDGGENWITIVGSVLNTGEHTWIPPAIESDIFKIRVTDANNVAIADTCDGYFSIASSIVPSGNEIFGTLTLDHSPYYVLGEAKLPQGKTLTIEPGVEVRFNTDPQGFLKVYGKLIAEGTESSNILFTRDGTEGSWGQIHFYDSSDDGSVMKNCVLEYATTLFVESANPTFENLLVTNCASHGISIDNGNPKFTNSTITDNGGAGFYLDYANSKIIGCLISNNSADGVHCHANSDPGIINSTIVNNGGTGVYAWQFYSYPYLKNSILWGNNVSVGGSSGGVNVYYSLIEESSMPPRGIDQGNNIFGLNPGFVSNNPNFYSLTFDSPCINTGTPDTTGLNLPPYDLAAHLRIANDTIDMGAYEFHVVVQKLILSKGWSGISSHLSPQDTDVEFMFSPIITDLIILQNDAGFYWPDQNINTLVNWNTHDGYQIKVANTVELTIAGIRENNLTLQLAEGWNLIPVLSECAVDVEDLFNGTNVTIIKEVAGWGVYWPAFGINTLELLKPGKAYFVMMESEGEITFPECTPIPAFPLKGEGANPSTKKDPENQKIHNNRNAIQRNGAALSVGAPLLLEEKGPGDVVKRTPSTHTIAIPTLIASGLPTGTTLSTHDGAGNCFGSVALNGGVTALTLFGDDPLTGEKDGFMEGEPVFFYSYLPDSKTRELLEVTFDSALPDSDGAYSTHGLSAIKSLTAGSSVITEGGKDEIRIYPNPSTGILNIEGLDQSAKISIYNALGDLIFNDTCFKGTQIDLATAPRGFYLIKIKTATIFYSKKVVLK